MIKWFSNYLWNFDDGSGLKALLLSPFIVAISFSYNFHLLFKHRNDPD